MTYEAHPGVTKVVTHQPWRGERVIGQFPGKLADGDRLAATALDDGTVHVYRNGALVGSADTRPAHGDWFAERGGWVGVAHNAPANRARIDDCTGGTVG